jgi:hypothetical protein
MELNKIEILKAIFEDIGWQCDSLSDPNHAFSVQLKCVKPINEEFGALQRGVIRFDFNITRGERLIDCFVTIIKYELTEIDENKIF